MVVGAGSWGTTVAALVGPELADRAVGALGRAGGDRSPRQHENPAYLPGVALPDAPAVATASLAEAVAGADLVLMAVPSHGFRGVLERLAPSLPPGLPSSA